MSLGNFFKDFFTGNFTHAEVRFEDWWQNTADPAIKQFMAKAATDQSKIAEGLFQSLATDVMAKGLTKDGITAAVLDVEQQLIAQEINLGRQYLFALFNAILDKKVADAATGTPTAASPADAAPQPDSPRAP